MNRLAADQVSDQIRSIRNLADQKSMVSAIRKMAIAQAKIAGSPDAEELIDYLIKEEGILQHEERQKASVDELARVRKLKAQQDLEHKEAQQRKAGAKKAKFEAKKAEEELEQIQLIKYEENRKAQQRKLEAERVKEVMARQSTFLPGTWKFRTCESKPSQDQSCIHEMSISFTSGGLFSTEYKSNSKGVKTASEISGTWDYDYVRQVLKLSGTHRIKHIPGGLIHRLMSLLRNDEVLTNPYETRFTITGSPDGLFEAYDDNGVQWQITRSS